MKNTESENSSKRAKAGTSPQSKTELCVIAASIHEKNETCLTLLKSIKAKGREASVLAWEIGGLLRQAKNELKGEFTAWRDTSIPGLAPATSSRYLALANRIPERKDLEELLDAGVSLTQLYREVGILPEKNQKPEKETGENGATNSQPEGKRGRQKFTAKVFLTALTSVAEKTAKLREKAPISQWSAEERDGFRKAFNALKAVDDEIAASESSSRRTIGEEVGQVNEKPKSQREAA